jgi:hypothetical protein
VIFSAKASLASAAQDHEAPGRQLAVVGHACGQAQQVGQFGVAGAGRGQAHGRGRAPLGQEIQHRLRRSIGSASPNSGAEGTEPVKTISRKQALMY